MKKLLEFSQLIGCLLICTACNAPHLTPVTEQVSITPQPLRSSTVIPPACPTDIATAPFSSAPSPPLIPKLSPSPLPTVPPLKTVRANAVAFIVGDWQGAGADALWIANIDGSGETKLADEVQQVVWSPDGHWLSCLRENSLWLISPDHATQRLLYEPAQGEISHVAWSPDSTKIAFVQSIRYYEPTYRLAIMEVANSRDTYHLETTEPLRVTSWAPNGQWLALSRPFSHLELINTTTGKMVTLNPDHGCTGFFWTVVWAPSSDRLAFLNTADNHILPRVVDTPGQLLYAVYGNMANYTR